MCDCNKQATMAVKGLNDQATHLDVLEHVFALSAELCAQASQFCNQFLAAGVLEEAQTHLCDAEESREVLKDAEPHRRRKGGCVAVAQACHLCEKCHHKGTMRRGKNSHGFPAALPCPLPSARPGCRRCKCREACGLRWRIPPCRACAAPRRTCAEQQPAAGPGAPATLLPAAQGQPHTLCRPPAQRHFSSCRSPWVLLGGRQRGARQGSRWCWRRPLQKMSMQRPRQCAGACAEAHRGCEATAGLLGPAMGVGRQSAARRTPDVPASVGGQTLSTRAQPALTRASMSRPLWMDRSPSGSFSALPFWPTTSVADT